MTDAQRKVKRDYHRKRYRDDPEYRARYLARCRAWKAKKLNSCPHWKILCSLRSDAARLRNSIKFHRKRILLIGNKLVKMAREIRKLEIECRGK